MDIVNFVIHLANGKAYRKSDMDATEWAAIYPFETVRINGEALHLTVPEVMNITLPWQGAEMKLRSKPFQPFRFFMHHNGRADMGAVGKQYATTFGVVYPDQNVLYTYKFNTDGEMETGVKRFVSMERIV